MKEIKTKKGEISIVDDEVHEIAKNHKWRLVSRYLATTINGKTLYLHHLVIGQPLNGLVVDHINRNRFDNRKENLRICTQSENRMNSVIAKHNSTGFKGVVKRASGYTATISKKHLGYFKTAEEAGKAYNEESKKLYGEYAFPNTI